MVKNIKRSLRDMLGDRYLRTVCAASAALTGRSEKELWEISVREVDFYPSSFADKQEQLMLSSGQALIAPLGETIAGAPTASFREVQNDAASPISALGCFRAGEDGRLYFAAKSEHYHTSLGHGFPGYELIALAQRLGISNAAHNNTRGYITRLCERRIAAAADTGEERDIDAVLKSDEPGALNRIINLETGSLAVEAAIKMMLNRFYNISGGEAAAPGLIPVFLVMGDNAEGITAGYHGTTFLAQTLRGLWPEYLAKAEAAGLYRVVPVKINDSEGFTRTIEEYNRPPYKTAGFFHEIVMMNYGAIVLKKEFLQSAYRDCRRFNTPVLCDEIQSCAWYGEIFLFKRYGIKPDFLAMGKGLPGGNYPASRILCTAQWDNLIQFGALVTNGQEELASLSYLITMEFISENKGEISANGQYFHERLQETERRHPDLCAGVEGDAHMSALCFKRVEKAVDFCARMQRRYAVDISAQAYKPNCPPAALVKLPLITSPRMMDALCDMMDQCLTEIGKER